MQSIGKPIRAVSLLLLLALLNSLVLPTPSRADDIECGYDAANPTLESARNSFLGLNYECAEKELNDLLDTGNLTTEDKADAHILLAEVYYAKVRNDKDKRDKVMEQFVAAFDAYRQWRGEVNIKSPEFMAMMKEAQDMVDSKEAKIEPEEVESSEKIAATPVEEESSGMVQPIADESEDEAEPATMTSSTSESKPLYKKWWAIALGIGVVAGAVVLLGGGGDDGGSDEPVDTLPYFPPPPDVAKRGR